MKTNLKTLRTMEPAQLAVLLGLTLGLGIAVHESFFLVAGAIAVGAIAVATVKALENHAEWLRPRHQH
jgi:ABC-type proline/glycine betaine transport system permease subunit